MHISETQVKIIAVGLIPAFVILSFVSPKNAAGTILPGAVMFTAFVLCFTGMSMQKEESNEDDDPPGISPQTLISPLSFRKKAAGLTW